MPGNQKEKIDLSQIIHLLFLPSNTQKKRKRKTMNNNATWI